MWKILYYEPQLLKILNNIFQDNFYKSYIKQRSHYCIRYAAELSIYETYFHVPLSPQITVVYGGKFDQ